MARKSFLFSGTRGRIGNIVVRQQEGTTVLAQAPTSVKNPKTYGQALQRMRMAAVTKFYSPLSTMLQESFQGLSTRKSYNTFTKAALAVMKSRDLGVRRDAGFTPLPLQVSRGSLRPVGARVHNGLLEFAINSSAAAGSTIGTLSRAIINTYGAEVGWQCSVLLLIQAESNTYYPLFFRFKIDPSDSAEFVDVAPGIDLSYSTSVIQFDPLAGPAVGGAVILSCYERGMWRRSTEYVALSDAMYAVLENDFDDAVSDFQAADATSTPDGSVYLDGVTRGGSGGGGIAYDPADFSVLVGDAASTLKAVAVTLKTHEETPYVALRLSDGNTYFLQGNDRMASFNKFFTQDGVQVDVPLADVPAAQRVAFAEVSVYEGYQWVSQESGLPLSVFFN